MDPGVRTPLLDYFRRGEVERDVRRLAAGASLAPAALEQLALLVMLLDDKDVEIQAMAADTVRAIPNEPLAAFLARREVPQVLRDFFKQRGIEPATMPAPEANEPLIDNEPEIPAEAAQQKPRPKILSQLPVMDRMKLAMRGTREQRGRLIRDANKMIAVAVLSSPKLTETEVESYARMADVSDEVLRFIGTSRSWVKSYAVAAALTRNPKTPPAISMRLLPRLSERDVKVISTDRNVHEPVRLVCQKMLAAARSRKK